MPTITHFDISADDVNRAKEFYTNLFDWKFEKLPGPSEYYLITTTNEKGEIGIGGGMAKREKPGDAITNFIDVPSIDEYITKVEKLGGKVLNPKQTVPCFGYLAVCMDTENNVFGLWETDESSQ
jgi:predicted enzyme related to lactoylglutathione lyase